MFEIPGAEFARFNRIGAVPSETEANGGNDAGQTASANRRGE